MKGRLGADGGKVRGEVPGTDRVGGLLEAGGGAYVMKLPS